MSEKNKQETTNFRGLYPRFLHFGLSYSDLERVLSTTTDWPSFARQIADLAENWEKTGDQAAKAGRRTTPRGHWKRAADYYHFAQLKLADSLLKEKLKNSTRRCYSKFLTLDTPPAIRCEIPFDSVSLPGFLRIAKPGAPCVILIGGLDSAKEVELHYFAEVFLERSCSVFYFDGPGQGELYGRVGMNGAFEKAVASVITFLASDARVRPSAIGCFGVAFGGYLACRAAASNPGIDACVSMGGFFDSGILAKLPDVAKTLVLKAFGFPAEDNISALAPHVSLDPLRGQMKTPLLIVYGTADHLVDMNQISAMQKWACGPVETIILEGSEHACTDRFNECLPRVGDWMTDWLLHKNIQSIAVV